MSPKYSPTDYLFSVVILVTLLSNRALVAGFGISTSMFTHSSMESDFLYLRYSATSTGIGGVFTTHPFTSGDIICQPRGHMIPLQNISFFNISSILTYNLYPPESPEARFILIENTICSRIRFCMPSTGDSLGSCGNAALFRNQGANTIYVQAVKPISTNTEVIVEIYDNGICNLDAAYFTPACQFDAHGCTVKSVIPPIMLGVKSSDDLLFTLAPSTIPGAGLGVFTKYAMPAYQILMLCQGRVYDTSTYLLTEATKPDRLTARIYSVSKSIQMDNICGFTNDIIDIAFLENTTYSRADYCGSDEAILREIPKHSGVTYNAGQGLSHQVVYISASKDIPANTEIFQPFGKSYWWYVYQRHHGLRCD